ncbi:MULTISPECIES: LysR family transcriptional regulator [Variovorax]|uniref:LysR family transcriptional regulator n=1 Tax=Variovorax ginsengisoli TaxID=363844 RepID=A0ABT8S965_9BURK|nr:MULTISPECIES: LysR family transcriptional regulator [Variovorax]MDM0065347.1 LysR family transcriptional regulator [Variovorax sp. J31P207]MDN8616284.1 LysR family transcriptional regulator [Variovorax ginsengisoli]MDO1535454.1 LysR family transcriptional regulator [Variovorax ginsengisoli]
MAALDLEWIAVFDEVYKASSVTKAAERLGLTQGAASTALNRLRGFYGDPLFTRTSRGMLATPRADELQPVLRQIRESLEGTLTGTNGFDPSTSRRAFRICMTDLGETSLLPALLNTLQSSAPGVRIDAERIGSESRRRLEEGLVDLAVGYMPQLDAGFYQQSLVEQDFRCIAAASHPRLRRRLTDQMYSAERHIEVLTEGTGHTGVIQNAIRAEGIVRQVALQVPSFLAVAQIVSETDLLAMVPTHYALVTQRRESIKVYRLPFPSPRYVIKQHWHSRFHRDPANIWLRQTVAKLMPSTVRRESLTDRQTGK